METVAAKKRENLAELAIIQTRWSHGTHAITLSRVH